MATLPRRRRSTARRRGARGRCTRPRFLGTRRDVGRRRWSARASDLPAQSTSGGSYALGVSVGAEGGLWAPRRRALTTGLILTITFIASEALAVVTVMPLVARDLHGLSLYGWVFSTFMLGSLVGIVVAGRDADRHGPARPYVAGVVLFGAGLLVAGLAPTMPVLVVGRLLQ